MFDVDRASGAILVSGLLDWHYVAVSYFQIQANNTLASYTVQKTDISTISVSVTVLVNDHNTLPVRAESKDKTY